MLRLKTLIGLLTACAVGILIGSAVTYIVMNNNRGLHIQSFSADSQTVVIGDKVTFRWNIAGATGAALRFVHMPTGSHGDLWETVQPNVISGNLPPSGEWSYTLPPEATESSFKFELEGSDEAGHKVAARSDVITVKFRPCFTGTDECATEPLQTRATLQAFEHGYMLQREDTQTIYVMVTALEANKRYVVIGWHAYPDTWAEGQSFELVGQPPAELHPPLGRFSKIMAINYGLQDDLGWATAPETVFEAAIQQTRNICNNGCSPALLIQLDDGRVLRLAASQPALEQGYVWQIIPAATDSKS